MSISLILKIYPNDSLSLTKISIGFVSYTPLYLNINLYKATSLIDYYIEFITELLSKDYAYISNGNIYFDTSKLDEYYIFNKYPNGFNGMYNITKIAIEATKSNPHNFTFGTVSPNFDKEMKSPDMDVAPGLGQDLREIKTISPLNGSTPASLGLDNNTADFGRGGNILSERKHGYTPLVYDGDIEKYLHDKELNAKWFTDILSEAQEKGQDALNKVFFNDLQIEQGRSVMGNISDFHPGKDLLIIGWGRPDEQKAFPITLEGYIKFLENLELEDVYLCDFRIDRSCRPVLIHCMECVDNDNK